MKFLLWGAGWNGEIIINAIGSAFFRAAIDSDENIVGRNIGGVPIISKNSLSEADLNFPLLITSTIYKDEILKEAKTLGFKYIFSISTQDLIVIKSLSIYLNRYCICDNPKKIILVYYELEFLPLYAYFYLSKNYSNYYIVTSCNQDLPLFINGNQIDISEAYNIDNNMISSVFVIHKSKFQKFKDKIVEIDKIDGYKDFFANKNLIKFNYIHKGERCFIIGNGPSLKIKDLEKLFDNHEYTFAVNGIVRCYGQTRFRPTYYCMSDIKARIIYEKELINTNPSTIFASDFALLHKETDFFRCANKIHLITQKPNGNFGFSDDICCGVYWGYTVLYDLCLQIAIYMGFNEIYFLGADCTKDKPTNDQHFITNYSNLNFKAKFYYDEVMDAYAVAKQYADTHGIKVFNATRGGNLEVFPRVDFDSLFPCSS